jgi:hypothetical protein
MPDQLLPVNQQRLSYNDHVLTDTMNVENPRALGISGFRIPWSGFQCRSVTGHTTWAVPALSSEQIMDDLRE